MKFGSNFYMLEKIFVILFLISSVLSDGSNTLGYIMYCPCMGRFGNQADHLLGVLAFSKAINRTLVIPPWVEYRKGAIRSNQVPFHTYFQVQPLLKYNKVILMHEFMDKMAYKIWPVDQRTSFCFIERQSLNKTNTEKGCHAKDGNPFGPFWDTYNVSFQNSEFYGPLHFDVHHSSIAHKWVEKYPPAKWPVIAFTGAPASFPVQIENRYLQKYIIWNDKYKQLVKNFIKNVLPLGAFIGIHLRNGIDWVRACEHIKNSQNLFASPQCLGYNNEKGELSNELCMPPKELIIKQLKRLIKKVKQENPLNQIKSIFVASDSNHMIEDINSALARMNVTAYKLHTDDSHLDLAILGSSNHFIGNCISSFTGFVKRERDIRGFPSYFWGFPKEKERRNGNSKHDEL